MCAGAIAEARIAKLFYGAPDIKGGAVDNGVALFDQKCCHHAPEVIGACAKAIAPPCSPSFSPCGEMVGR